MALYDGSATVSGSGQLAGSGGVIYPGSSTVPGLATTPDAGYYLVRGGSVTIQGLGMAQSPYGGVNHMGSATAKGSTFMAFESVQDGSATIQSVATSTVDGYRVLHSTKVYFRGTSQILQTWPVVFRGSSRLIVAGYSVESSEPATTTSSIPVFRWQHLFQRGDLQLFLCDGTGPFHPVSIRYQMYRVLPCGARQAVGPPIRYPARGRLGEFYVTGRAGEHGQPGDWLIRWSFQRNFYDQLSHVEQCFRVVDATLRDNTTGQVPCCRSGWN